MRAHHEIDINAPLRTVWQLHTDVNSWPAWQTEITAAHLDGPFQALAIRARYSSSCQSLQRMMVPGGYSKSVSPRRLKPAFRQIALDAG